MKQLFFSLVAILCITLCACAKKSENKSHEEVQNNKIAVTYFSATGTTKAVAEKIAAATSGTLFEITPVPAYTAEDLDWRDENSRSTIDMKNPASRPEIKPVDVSEYDVVYIGFPIWWDEAPREVNTFIESQNLQGKKIILFATSGGSTIDNSAKMLKQTYPELNILSGKLLNGVTEKDVEEWVKEN